MASMPDHRKRNTFQSYVAPPPEEQNADAENEWRLQTDNRDVYTAKPRLLNNEHVVAAVPAYMFPAIAPIELDASTNDAIFGLLSVTNFKLAFVPLHKQTAATATTNNLQLEAFQDNQYLSHNDVTLNNIDQIFQMSESTRTSVLTGGNRRKKLEAQQNVMTARIASIHIICKNFRLLKFAFQSNKGGRDYGKVIAQALMRFAFRPRHDLSFAFAYRESYFNTLIKSSMTMYTSRNDWTRELIRCGATEWQVVSAENVPQLQNKLQASKYTLPMNFVIPKCCTVERFLDLSRAFWDSRAAFWVYGYGKASLVRLAELKSTLQQDSKLENVTLELVRKCDERKTIHLMQLTDHLPNVQAVQRAYERFRRLCAPESVQQFLLQDVKFLGLLEKSNWLFYVSLCLRLSCEAAETLRAGISCVLQETNGRDMCCLISSLTQIILDPFFRSIDGFQSLVQKEWVALEHPFQRRLGHVRSNAGEAGSAADENESPVFLLFLDCVWQMLVQFPDEFEFSETYLTTLWDACFMPIFDTFQFDCEADRQQAVREQNLILRPVWDWGEQFSEKDKIFFTNPLYQRPREEQRNRRSMAMPPAGGIMLPGLASTSRLQAQQQQKQQQQRYTINPQLFVTQSTIPKDRYLQPVYFMFALSVWEQCYYRWMPLLEIPHGGTPQVELYHRLLLSNISKLQRCLELQEFDDLPDVYYELTGEERATETDTVPPMSTVMMEDGVERRQKPKPPKITNGLHAKNLLPSVSSFFPFSQHSSVHAQQLNDILLNSKDYQLEGSIMDRMSINYA